MSNKSKVSLTLDKRLFIEKVKPIVTPVEDLFNSRFDDIQKAIHDIANGNESPKNQYSLADKQILRYKTLMVNLLAIHQEDRKTDFPSDEGRQEVVTRMMDKVDRITDVLIDNNHQYLS